MISGISEFYMHCSPSVRERIEEMYFTSRRREISKVINACAEDVRKNYSLLILGEMQHFKKMFGIDFDCVEGTGFMRHVTEIFKKVFRRNDKEKIAAILGEMNENSDEVEQAVDNVFRKVYSTYCTCLDKTGDDLIML